MDFSSESLFGLASAAVKKNSSVGLSEATQDDLRTVGPAIRVGNISNGIESPSNVPVPPCAGEASQGPRGRGKGYPKGKIVSSANAAAWKARKNRKEDLTPTIPSPVHDVVEVLVGPTSSVVLLQQLSS